MSLKNHAISFAAGIGALVFHTMHSVADTVQGITQAVADSINTTAGTSGFGVVQSVANGTKTVADATNTICNRIDGYTQHHTFEPNSYGVGFFGSLGASMYAAFVLASHLTHEAPQPPTVPAHEATVIEQQKSATPAPTFDIASQYMK